MLSIISAKNRTFAHIQPITFSFLISSSACFLYSVPLLQAHLCDPATCQRHADNHHTEDAGAQEYRYYAGVCQDIGGSKERSGRKNKNPINDNKMKKQLFDLTIEEFTSVLLDYQPTLELSFLLLR